MDPPLAGPGSGHTLTNNTNSDKQSLKKGGENESEITINHIIIHLFRLGTQHERMRDKKGEQEIKKRERKRIRNAGLTHLHRF